MALVFAAAYATISVARFEQFATRSFDLGIFEQAIRAYAHLQAPIVELEGPGINFLGDHWSPAIAVFAPFYRLFPSALTLLVGQALVIALAVVPITRAAMSHLGRWSGVAVGLAFGMSFGVQSAVDFDFHEVALAAPLLAFACEALLAGRWMRVAAWAAPLVLVKEDLGLTVAALGVVLVLIGARRWGIGLFAFGVASFAFTLTILIPHFNAQGSQGLTRLAIKSGADDSVLQRMFDLLLTVVTPGPRATTVLLLILVMAFVGLRSPLVIVLLPTLAWRFISTNPNVWGQSFHYDLVLMPIAFAALVDGMMRARRSRRQILPGFVRAAPILALTVGLVLCTRSPLGGLFNPATYRPSPRAQAAEQVLAQIPDGATVETDFVGLIAKLTNRSRVFRMGITGTVVPQFVLIDAITSEYPRPRHPLQLAESLHPGTTYMIALERDGYTLMRHVP